MITLAVSQSHKFSERLKRIPKNFLVRNIVCKQKEKSFSQLHFQSHKAEILMLLFPCFSERLLTKINRQDLYFEISCIWQNNSYVRFLSCVSLLRVDELYQGFWILESDDKTQAHFLYLYLRMKVR